MQTGERTPNLTAQRLREVLYYDPDTGIFKWRVRTSNRVSVGQVAGTPAGDGYVLIRIGKRCWAHRLAWLYMTGKWPDGEVDHWDTNRSNNRWSNLRDVSGQTNSQNLRKAKSTSSSGLLGAFYFKSRDCFRAQISVNGRAKHIGYFTTAELAHAAYVKAKRALHAGCTI